MSKMDGTRTSSVMIFRRLPLIGSRIFGERERGGFSSLNRAGGGLFLTSIGSRREEEEDSRRESSPLYIYFFCLGFDGLGLLYGLSITMS